MCDFTKGEWVVGSHKIKDSDCWGVDTDFDCGWNYVGTNKGVIAMVVTKSYTDTEMDANAHLIASAPEMYEVLSKIMTHLNHGCGDAIEYLNNSDHCINKLLAKARGEHV